MQRAIVTAIMEEAKRQGITHDRLSWATGHRTDVFGEAFRTKRIGIHRMLEAAEVLNLDLLMVNPEGVNIL